MQHPAAPGRTRLSRPGGRRTESRDRASAFPAVHIAHPGRRGVEKAAGQARGRPLRAAWPRPAPPPGNGPRRKNGPYGWARRLIRTAVVVLTQEAVQVTDDGTALVPFQLAWNPNTVDAPEPSEPL
ncbi:hypothetical protein GCM10010116_20050 [Microbispora rosea subsp. aerata]|nr:hypothetical protein GCM10010116_20050 [Microbispora rosea subsp. aerata]GIH53381.1 hypothetical protein Mro02_02950 [Microbispora rosea subsp. aerata]GLJ83061.1 hypothetical protein GCM10017588_17870 [Microbispora rosea subsp. aerata]